MERCLQKGNHLLTISGIWTFLLPRLLEPLAEVFLLHSQQAPGSVQPSLHTAQLISSLLGIEYSTVEGVVPTGIGWTSKGMCQYRSTLFSSIHLMVTLMGGGGGGGLTASFYHPTSGSTSL